MCVGIAPARVDDVGIPHRAEGSSLVCSARRPGATASAEVGARQRHARGRRGGSRPSVQIGDPFAGKLLIEASLEMIEADCWKGCGPGRGRHLVRGQRIGRARAAWEPISTWTPCRFGRGLEAFEILTSESQERMLAVVAPERLADVRAVCGSGAWHRP
jgi:phosphoribosylformylglycinamidine synthase